MPRSLAPAAFAALSLALLSTAAAQNRMPIRVGGNVQEAKLIHRVDPVYPDEAKAARVSGVVILQVTVDETGAVVDIKTLRGHPLLDSAASAAVRQWRYQPTLLNGEPVPVIATVTVVFNLQQTRIVMNAAGIVSEEGTGLTGDALRQKLAEGRDVVLTLEPAIPSRLVEEGVRALVRSGVGESRIKGACVFYDRRMYYLSPSPEVEPAEPALDDDRLAALARESLAAAAPPFSDGNVGPFLYRLYVTEVGEIAGVERLRAPNMPAVESELRRSRVVTPGRRGGDPVAVAVAVEVRGDARAPGRAAPR